jgi:hypothetical protein
MDGDCPRVVLHSMNAGSRKREAISRAIFAHAPGLADDQRLVARASVDDVDTDAGAVVVVVARVSRLPPLDRGCSLNENLQTHELD